MTVSKSENFLDRTLNSEMTRRKFMKVSGKSIVGVAISASFLSLIGCTQEQVTSGKVTLWSTPQGLLVVNEAKCTGCQRCEINCTQVNDGYVSSYVSRAKVSRNLMLSHLGNGLLTDNWVYFPDTCRQCEDPSCGNACPVQAISSDDRGVKKVDQSKCVGCGTCSAQCPWEMPTVNPETRKSSKCILCGSCATGCPTGALSVVDWDSVTAALQKTRK
ncbi:ferredoxin-like protein [Desulfitobacterium sp. PCE1]|uniref:ferredoxin-like protein n=1 Tax=Desulfitobacterium sp. PCE1 TaxID=146907 RepID=UPI0003A2293E|nr:ferredoxin-like protein [Desulfitobacterium sp. PCE1]